MIVYKVSCRYDLKFEKLEAIRVTKNSVYFRSGVGGERRVSMSSDGVEYFVSFANARHYALAIFAARRVQFAGKVEQADRAITELKAMKEE